MNSITNETKTIISPYLPHDLGNLPIDLFKVIHSILNPMHTELFATVSKTWQANCCEIARDDFLLIKPFINWLNQNLAEKEETKSKLLACYDVNERSKSIKKKIQAVLQELNKETLMDLETLSIKDKKPKFFKDCLHLAAVANSLKNIVQQVSSQSISSMLYFQLTSELAQKGYFYKAIVVKDMIIKDVDRDCALGFICKELFRDRLFDQTKDLLLKISDKSKRKDLVQNFISILRNHNETQKALDYMTMLFY